MKSIHKQIVEALSGLPAEVSYFYPTDWAKLPAVSYYEMTNTPDSISDDEEYSTELEYIVDVWANTPSEMISLAESVNAAMIGIGMVRAFAHEQYEQETKINHKTMRFKGVF